MLSRLFYLLVITSIYTFSYEACLNIVICGDLDYDVMQVIK